MMNDATKRVTNVLMTADTVGGVWTYALELCRALESHGVEVTLATMGARLTRDQHAKVSALGNVHVHESDFALEWMDDPWSDVSAAGEWLLEIAASTSPDVVHLNGYLHATLEWNAPVLVVAHSCVLSWWRAVHGEDAPLSWSRYRGGVEAGLAAANLVVAPTDAVLSALRECYAWTSATRVIHNGIPVTSENATKTKEPIILSAGRVWDEAKNIRVLGELAGDLDWPIYIAGDASTEALPAAAWSNLHMLGKIPADTLEQWMHRAAIYASPALYEPFGLSILEAANAGCALVLSDIPSLRELWHDAAVFVPPKDSDAMRAALASLIGDPSRCDRLAANARRRAHRYNSATMVSAYLRAYTDLCIEAPPGAQRVEAA